MVWKWLHCSAVREDPPNISNLCSAVTTFLPPLFHSLSSFYTIHPPFLFALALFAHVFHHSINIQSWKTFDVWSQDISFTSAEHLKRSFDIYLFIFFLESARGHGILEGTFWHQMNKWLHNNWHNALIFISSCLGAFVNLEWKGDEWPYSRKNKMGSLHWCKLWRANIYI